MSRKSFEKKFHNGDNKSIQASEHIEQLFASSMVLKYYVPVH